VTLLKGGDGGRGNASYKTSTNRAPRQHGTGWPSEEMWVWLRLKLLADVGLVGLPNAGKSTFLNSTTNAAAKVGEYPFTTLRPQLGVARHKGREFVIADIPGLIEGAAEGAGIGDRFLGHVERCRVLLHLVDAAGDDPVHAWRVVRGELDAYGADLAGKPEVVALSRADLVDGKQLAKVKKALDKASGGDALPISAPIAQGIEELLDAIVERLGSGDLQPTKSDTDDRPWSPL
jgi:GTP-binding protein